jgi:hypothetical protein
MQFDMIQIKDRRTIFLRAVLEGRLLSFSCPFKSDMTFRITIRLKVNSNRFQI